MVLLFIIYYEAQLLKKVRVVGYNHRLKEVDNYSFRSLRRCQLGPLRIYDKLFALICFLNDQEQTQPFPLQPFFNESRLYLKMLGHVFLLEAR